MLTRAEIVSAMAEFDKVVGEWQALDENTTDTRVSQLFRSFHGRVVRAIQPFVAEAAEKLFVLCDTTEAEQAAWPLIREIDKFDDAFTACAQAMLIAGADQDPSGGNAVWGAWEWAKKERDSQRVFRAPEPIPQLRAMRNPPSPEQICKMYHWYDEHGLPDVARLQREIDQPGSEFDPATWVNPWAEKYWGEMRVWWEQRCRDLETAGTSKKAQGAKPAVHESLEELILQGVNRDQIKKMVPGTTDDEIDALCLEYGVALDSQVHGTYFQAMQARDAAQRAANDRQLSSRLSTIETYADLGDDLDARIVKMAEDGRKASVIAAALKNQLPHPLTAAEVGKRLARIRREAAGVST